MGTVVAVGVLLGVGERVGDGVAEAVDVAVLVGDGVGVFDGVLLAVGDTVGLAPGVLVLVAVTLAAGVALAVGVVLAVAVLVGVPVAVLVAVLVAVAELVGSGGTVLVGVLVTVAVAVAVPVVVGVAVAVGLGVGGMTARGGRYSRCPAWMLVELMQLAFKMALTVVPKRKESLNMFSPGRTVYNSQLDGGPQSTTGTGVAAAPGRYSAVALSMLSGFRQLASRIFSSEIL